MGDPKPSSCDSHLTMSIQQQVLLRYRSEGHLRFALPAALSTPEIGDQLVAELATMEGIYRVDVFPRQGKLSIRYLDTVCDFAAVVRRLYALVGELAGKRARTPRRTNPGRKTETHPVPRQASGATVRAWVRAKLEEAGETVKAAGIVIGSSFRALGQRPRWVTEFLNDLVMLYLIKLHWHHIITLWLPNPWRYRYEWMATFYLIYLSVQSRLPKPA